MTPPTESTIASFTSDVLAIEVDGHVATLWLDRPEKRNAMGPDFWSDLPRAMAAIGSDPGRPGGGGGRPRTPLLRGAGPGGHVRTHRGGRIR